MNPFRRVLVALARNSSDSGLLAYARMLAGLDPESEFRFVHVLGWQTAGHDHSTAVTHEQALQQIRDSIARSFGPSPKESAKVLHGSRVDRILELAADSAADLILVGHGRQGGRRSLARRLAMKAPCSLWMVPDGRPARVSRILAPVDFSGPSAHALSCATAIASAGGIGQCRALHVYFDESIAAFDEYREGIRGREQQAFAKFVAPLDLHGVQVDPVFEESASVAHAVERVVESNGVDLIVMGTRGQSLSAAVLLGSESEQVLMETTAPVLVVKHRGERIGLLQVLLDRDFHGQPEPKFG
jgi:sulfate permease, SulP family